MSSPTLAPQTVLRDRYLIIDMIGQGGMGAVYKAEDKRLTGRLCAIKEIIPALLGGYGEDMESYQIQFHQEASTLARLDHPNLPKVSDYFSADDREYLVMDFVAGQDLRQIIDETRSAGEFLTEDQVLDWARQLCDALAYLHTRTPPVLHRDVKPSNIKLTPSGHIKLVDFGLVKLLMADESRTVTVVQGRGTIQYTPLEQYGGDTGHTDVRSDIYALGGTLYHLLTLRPPIDARQRFLHPGSLPLPRTVNPAISLGIERAVLAAMAMHPGERPPSVEDFAELLFSTHDIIIPGNTYAVAEPTLADALQSNRALLIIAGILLILALLVSLGSALA